MKIDRPNILFILSDQHASNVLGCYGDKIVRTPNIDQLSSEGITFDNVYTPSPICVPSRMSMLTGKFPYNQSCWTNSDCLPSDIPTFAHSLGSEGYYPTLIGRLHAIGPDQLHGYAKREVFDHSSDWYGGSPYSMGVLDKAQRPFLEAISKSGPGQTSYELMDKDVTDNSIKFLEKFAKKSSSIKCNPFALSVGYMLPHQPYVATPDLFSYYNGKVGAPKLSRPKVGDSLWLEKWREQTGLNKISEEDEIRARTAYYALIETLDQSIGKIIKKLKDLNLYENTLIIYASDHGEQMGERDLWWKQTFYEESVKVPLIMKWKNKFPKGERREQILNLVDLPATILDAARASPLPNIDGKSFLDIAKNKNSRKSCKTFSEFCTDSSLDWSGNNNILSRMVRIDKWKYNYYHGYNHQLFDLKNDPEEMINLSGKQEYRDIEIDLNKKILFDWKPKKIIQIMKKREATKAILKSWAKSVKPPENYRWQTKMEDNWILK